jgi:hypothetical protein
MTVGSNPYDPIDLFERFPDIKAMASPTQEEIQRPDSRPRVIDKTQEDA